MHACTFNYWGAGDGWVHAPTGIELDSMFFETLWMEEQIERVMGRHQPALGYTTCFCYTVQQSVVFSDPRAWFARLQQQCRGEYPEPLRRNIIAYNHPVLRGIITSYAHQIQSAVTRRDGISVNHRLAALLASYFDILFALNRQLHPGEKRQLEFALNNCAVLPPSFEPDIAATLQAAGADAANLPGQVARLLDHLDQALEAEGLNPAVALA